MKRLGERVTENLKVSKTCGMNKSQGCIGSKFYDKNNEVRSDADVSLLWKDSSDVAYKVILADGMSLVISGVYGSGDWAFLVDIDGPKKGSSMFGKDLFLFTIPYDSYPTVFRSDIKNFTYPKACFENSYCAGWVIDNENLDYLKADSSGKCPNGTVLSETVTSCK